MLRIKKEVDLKELEKFGFYKDNYDVRYEYRENAFTGINIEPITNIIGIYSSHDIMINKKVLDTLFDLIQAGLVEKIEE